MNTLQVLKESKMVVKRLLLQYSEYTTCLARIDLLERNLLYQANKISKEKKLSLAETLSNESYLSKERRAIELLKLDLNQTSDEMTFKDPTIWMMYKDMAYKNTPKEISNMLAFRQHCSPEGYICTKRYKFLKDYLLKVKKIDLENQELYPDNLAMEKLYSDINIIALLEDLNFMEEWKLNEYKKTNGSVNKWNSKF